MDHLDARGVIELLPVERGDRVQTVGKSPATASLIAVAFRKHQPLRWEPGHQKKLSSEWIGGKSWTRMAASWRADGMNGLISKANIGRQLELANSSTSHERIRAVEPTISPLRLRTSGPSKCPRSNPRLGLLSFFLGLTPYHSSDFLSCFSRLFKLVRWSHVELTCLQNMGEEMLRASPRNSLYPSQLLEIEILMKNTLQEFL